MQMRSILLTTLSFTAIQANAQHNGTTGDMRNFATQTQVTVTRNHFDQKSNTVGTQYLFPAWVHGTLVTNDNQTYLSDLFNMDKIGQGLYRRLQNDSAAFLIDKSQVKSISLSDGNVSYEFEKIPSLKNEQFYNLLIKGKKYSLYSFTKTKFISSNYSTNGIVSSGNLFDEFKDATSYYILLADGTVKEIALKKKSIKLFFDLDKEKVEQFFKTNPDAEVNQNFLKLLVSNLNQ